MIRTSLVLATLLLLALMGCREDASASSFHAVYGPDPEQTVARMLALAEAGNWSAYVDEFYGETEKLHDYNDRWQLIERFKSQWGEHAVSVLREVSGIEPEMSDDKSKAVFFIERGRQFTLYLDTDRRWKFHL